jgi:replicative DNA helicase
MSQLIDSSIARQFERLPPHSIEAEMCLLASMMLDKEMIGQIVQIVDREAFYQADHQVIFDVAVKLYEQNRPIDAVIIREELAKRQLLEEVGGVAYLAQILNAVPSAAHGAHYASIVREKGMLRQLIAASNDILRDAYAPHEQADLVLDKAEKRIFEIAEKKVSGAMVPMETVLHEVFEMIENRGQAGVPTGFYDLDEMMNGLQAGEMIIVAARPSMGKAQPLDARVLTMEGWKGMGDLRIGDELASIDGKPSAVKAIYPQGRRQVYRITFADGRSTECCAEHLWRISYRDWDEPRVLSTEKLAGMLQRKRYQGRLSIELFSGDFGDDEGLPLDPWLLGALLGDGALGGSSVRFSTADDEMLERVRAAIGPEMTISHAGGYDYRLRQAAGASQRGRQGVCPNPLKVALQGLELWDCDAGNKFIPGIYLRASRESRLRLLAGLIDTDGWVEKWGSIRFSTCSERLVRGVVELVRSLGGTASYASKATAYSYLGERRAGQTAFVCNLQHPDPASLVLLSCKRDRLACGRVRQRRLNLVSIEPTRETDTQCIAVTHSSHLYVTDDYIVTHNTAFAMNLIEHIAADERMPVAVFSLEMSKQQLAQRMLCSRGEIDAHKLRKGLLNAEEYTKLATVVGELAKAPIWVDDSPGLTPLDLRAKCRRLKMQHDVRCIMIDYMQLMDNPGPESRQQQISEISRGIKAVARELSVPVIALSQLNRASEGRDGHRPRMSDLRESGSIEQDADVVCLLHREDYYRMSEPDFQPDNIAEIIVAKQRNGPTGTVKLTFLNKSTRFVNLAVQNDPFA